ncbi:hypothetical protein TH66_02705 [Carbonactinospora thermoautotrophica]|uniref:Uncharacterized protein n=1 Tax=Carbonactinospora thermoautotrophica TaxID=1469144 RepID=A0A132NF05_9ACTN|nr:nucleotide disphospho-sugar-binding domain-containing protein [Carbonactinospora thermoautotrophica]KWX05223.1 hypothetical protein TH66_02705 [Carbonactinospora thermoautotrophica]KWX08616.1 hypothetical protein TR74_14190 [Carbonactinospora thermoautotrophica]
MRVLFVAWAWPTHFLSMVPLAWAFQIAGHDVRVASQPALAGTISQAGLPAVQVGQDLDVAEVRRNASPEQRSDSFLDPSVCFQRSGTVPEEEKAKWLGMQKHFSLVAELMVDDLCRFVRDWRPDVVVWEPGTLAAPVAARAHGVPDIRLTLGLDVAGRKPDHIERQLRSPDVERLFARFGLPAEPTHARWTIDQCPPSLRLPTATERLSMRHVPYGGGGTVPDWVRQPPDRPRICVTWGLTTELLGSGDVLRLPQLLDAIADLDAEVVVLGAAGRPDLPERVPPHVRVTGYVPLATVLPTCSAVVHHGGGGTMLAAVFCGIPQLVVPQIIDQGVNAHQIERAGIGRVVNRDEQDPACIRDGLVALLTDDSYRQAALRLREETLAQPSAAQVVATLEEELSASV